MTNNLNFKLKLKNLDPQAASVTSSSTRLQLQDVVGTSSTLKFVPVVQLEVTVTQADDALTLPVARSTASIISSLHGLHDL